MRSFWTPIIVSIFIWIAATFFYFEIRGGGHYQLSAPDRVSAYLTLFTVASALTGSIFLIFQHFMTRQQLNEAAKPRLSLYVIRNTLNENPSERHRTSIRYRNLTLNDFSDLEITVFASLNREMENAIIARKTRKMFVEGQDSRDLNIFTETIFSGLGTSISEAIQVGKDIYIQPQHSHTFLRSKITRKAPIYVFNHSTREWDIDE